MSDWTAKRMAGVTVLPGGSVFHVTPVGARTRVAGDTYGVPGPTGSGVVTGCPHPRPADNGRVTDLIAFLRARLDEDEAIAREAASALPGDEGHGWSAVHRYLE